VLASRSTRPRFNRIDFKPGISAYPFNLLLECSEALWRASACVGEAPIDGFARELT